MCVGEREDGCLLARAIYDIQFYVSVKIIMGSCHLSLITHHLDNERSAGERLLPMILFANGVGCDDHRSRSKKTMFSVETVQVRN